MLTFSETTGSETERVKERYPMQKRQFNFTQFTEAVNETTLTALVSTGFRHITLMACVALHGYVSNILGLVVISVLF